LLTQIENLNKKLENEKLENTIQLSEVKKLKDEKQLTGIILAKFKKMDENFNDLLKDQEKLQNMLDTKYLFSKPKIYFILFFYLNKNERIERNNTFKRNNRIKFKNK
jgi:hypothetical protein